MARINIDSKFFADARVSYACMMLNEPKRALIGCFILVWNHCYSNKSNRISKKMIDAVAEKAGFAHALIESELADSDGDFLIIRGVSKRIDYLNKDFSKMGKLSAKSRQKKYGTAQPINTSEHDPELSSSTRSNMSRTQAEPSSSSSSSSSLDNKFINTNKSNSTLVPARGVSVKVLPVRDFLEIGEQWLEFAKREMPWNKSKNWNVETFADELMRISKATDLNFFGLQELLKFIQADEFWRKNAVSPFGMLKKSSKNGLRKIDNIIMRMKTRQHRVDEAIERFVNAPKQDDDLPF